MPGYLAEMTQESLPAILGGRPVRAAGAPAWPANDPEIAEALEAAFRDGSWGQYHGPHTTRLTEALAEYHQCEHVILCASGTAAVELALRGLAVGSGHEVVLGAYDFKGNFQDVLTTGAVPLLCDVLEDNATIDVDQLEAALDQHPTIQHPKAVLVSHLHGGFANMPRIMQQAAARGIPVIEDACQMPGAWLAGRRAGLWGDVGVLSFGGSKLLSAGRGGAVLTNNPGIAQRIRLYTQRGNEAYPLSELQAAVLLPQLSRLDARNAQRSAGAQAIVAGLSEKTGLRPFANHSITSSAEKSLPGYYKLGLWYDAPQWQGLTREEFATAMRAEGIPLFPGFRSLHRTHSRRRYRCGGSLAQADAADEQVAVLHHPLLLEGQRGARDFLNALERVRQFAARIHDEGVASQSGASQIDTM